MKKIFDKLNKVMFVLGIIALIVLILVLSGWLDRFGANISGLVMTTCLGIIFVFVIFAAISAVLMIVTGLKTDKVAFLKKFLSNVAWITVAYMIVLGLDYFHEAELPMEIDLGRIVLQIFGGALAILAGEYMITNHNEEKEELHF